MITIRDVAMAAGVSVSTVSHALSGKRTISEATKAKIRNAIEALGYEPNPNARALRGSGSGVIGLYAYDITESFAASIIKGVERVAREKNAYLLFTSGTEFDENLLEGIDFLKRRRVDGIIIAYGIRQPIAEDVLASLDARVVAVNTSGRPRVPSVQPDDLGGGEIAAGLLIAKGSAHPLFIGGPPSRVASADRLAGFAKGLQKSGIAFDSERQVAHGDFTPASGASCLDLLLDRCPDADAVFCANDYMAAGAINRAGALGISIPRDLKVIGYDDREFATFWPIPITSMALPLEEMGATSATMLFDRIEGREPEPMHLVLGARLVERAST